MIAALGRADLIRARRRLGPEGLRATARLLGLSETEPALEREREARPAGEPSPIAVSERPRLPLAPTRLAFRPVPFYQPVAVEILEAEVDSRPRAEPAPLSLSTLRPSGERPPSPALRPWPRLWPALRAALSTRFQRGEVDLDEVLRRLGRGEQLARIPRRERYAWAGQIVVVVDRSVALTPYWEDQDEVCRRLARLLGRAAVREWTLAAGPGSTPVEAAEDPAVVRLTEPAALLALGDLGLLTDDGETFRWLQWGRTLRRAGHRLAALAPVPPASWPRELARVWEPIWWDSGPAARPASAEERRARAERLLGLLSGASIVEPGLVREVRRLLPAAETDAGYEVDVWRHPVLQSRSWVGGTFAASEAARLRELLVQEDAELLRAVWRSILRWHLGLSPEVWGAEAHVVDGLRRGIVGEAELEQAEELLRQLLEVVRAAGESGRPFPERSEAWFRGLQERLPAGVWDRPGIGSALAGAWVWVARSDPQAEVPAGVSIRDVSATLPAASSPQRLTLRQEAGELVIEPVDRGESSPRPGSLLASLSASRALVHLLSDELRTQLRLDEGWRVHAPLPVAGSFEVASDLERVVLERRVRPSWATAMGRDPFGLWAEVALGETRLRLRWIPPGRFLMGSPEDEAGRWDDEGPQHLVTISRGLWLGATPVTQEQWQAVMEGNPSRFQSPHRPVEQVSWEDCQRFLERANERTPGLGLRLPSEAEWEYACRAGTTTATYAGPIEILGANHAPVLHAIAWYGGNSGRDFELEEGEDSSDWPEKQFEHRRAGTHPVARKDPNPWGLYDMLGNVWEWCRDWNGRYSGEDVEDPKGPSVGQSRVDRGGSWARRARHVRSACRYWDHPGSRYGYLGFRVARGPEPEAEAGKESGPRVAAEPPARSRRRRPRRGRERAKGTAR